MANTFSSSLMPRILAGALQVLREEVAFATRMSKDYEASAGHIGQQISVSIPYPASTYDVTPAAVPPALTDSNQLSRLVTINQWKGTRFSFTPKEVMEYDFSNSQYVPRAIAEAARAQARLVNQSIAALYTKIPNIIGVNDARLFASAAKLTNLSAIRGRLNWQLCPDEGRVLLMGLEDEVDAMNLDEVIKNPQMAGKTQTLEKGVLGNLYNIDLARDRDVVVAGAAGTGIVGTLTCAATAKGATTVAVSLSSGVSDAAHLHVGDVIMLSDDSSANYRRMYAVQEAVTIASGGSGTLTLDHPLETTLAGTETVEMYAKQGGCRQCIAGDLAGFGLVMRIPPSSIEGAPTIGPSVDMTDPVSGIPMKLTYLPGYHAAQWELSTMWGVDVVDWRRLLRAQSKTAA